MSSRVLVKDVKRAAKSLGRKIKQRCYFEEGACCPLAALTYDGVRRDVKRLDSGLIRRRIEKKFGTAYAEAFIETFDGLEPYNAYVGTAAKLFEQGKRDGEKLRRAFIK